MKKLSVITICYNEKDTIESTIKSVLSQDFVDYEYIIADGNSNDGTMEIIQKHSGSFRKIISENDKGIFDAMNKALQYATGEYVFFLNAGDFLVDNKVFSSVFGRNYEIDLLYGDVIFQYSNGIKFRRKTPDKLNENYFFIDSLNHQTVFMKRKLIEKIGGFDTSLKITSDYDLILNAIYNQNCKSKYINLPVSVFNLKGISSQKNYFEQQNNERMICLSRYFDAEKIQKMQRRKTLFNIYYKKIRYAVFLILSMISSKFLYGKDLD